MELKHILKQHFVTFMSPGTFVAETNTMRIDSWETETAIFMSKQIKQRHDALPYGFYFSTRSRDVDELDSRETARSCTYFLGGEILTLQDVIDRDNPDDEILIKNMQYNDIKRVVVNTNSWQWTQPMHEGDIVLVL